MAIINFQQNYATYVHNQIYILAFSFLTAVDKMFGT